MEKISVKSFLESLNSSSNTELDPIQLASILPSDFANELAHQILDSQTSSELPSILTCEEEVKQGTQENEEDVEKFEEAIEQEVQENEENSEKFDKNIKPETTEDNEEEDLIEINQGQPKPPKISLRKRIKQQENAILAEKGKIPMLPLGEELNNEVQISLKIKGEGIEFQRLRCQMATGTRSYKPREYFPKINSYISSPNITEAEIWISSEIDDVVLVYKRRNRFGREFTERVRVAPGFLLKIEVMYSEEVESFGRVVRKWIWCRDCDGQLRRFQNY